MDKQVAADAFHARLFQLDARDAALDLEQLPGLALDEDQLLWVDLRDPDASLLAQVCQALDLPQSACGYVDGGTQPGLWRGGDYFWLRVVAVSAEVGPHVLGATLTVIAGRNRVVSVHTEALPFIEEMRQHEDARSAIGGLCAESFVAALLDWHLATYFAAIAEYEVAIERLENDILAARLQRDTLPELRRLRRWASRLRRMLAPHRTVFAGLSRPDFRPQASETAAAHFGSLDTRFERAMDMVENARELVLGSFELFSSQTALQTNQAMRVLTFVTVITGGLATLVGALGMNFDAGFFKTQDLGFWVAVSALGVVSAAALLLGRWRDWF